MEYPYGLKPKLNQWGEDITDYELFPHVQDKNMTLQQLEEKL